MGQFVLNKEALKISGGILLAVLNRVIEESKIGISTKELAVYAEEEVKKLGGKPAFLGFGGYPAVICISVNEQVV
ncbi:MAG TPA: type I methionyl aminopeptidase, partial [Candidatus Saccharibacteria bacterium]|nr:type I methionyl aminopeptidase [Candidatus Saccharibacteria bacterium]